MSAEPLIHGAGTPERAWQAWDGFDRFPELEPVRSPLVVAPHPDDEILGAGGLLAGLGEAEIVAVTDGEASHPASMAVHPEVMAAVRRDETDEALRRLGISRPTVHRLGHPDGRVDEPALVAVLTELLRPGQHCLATWRKDGHPDHEAVGRAAARACQRRGARLLEYPVWTWHWAAPDDPRVPWHRARRRPLAATDRTAKRAALNAFVSQIAPLGPGRADAAVLPPHVLARFDRPFEVFFG